MNKNLLTQLYQRIGQADRILVVSHVRPDGDAVGSVLALGMALQDIDKQVVMALADGVPGALKFLPGHEQIVKKVEDDFDLIVAIDSGSLDRIGNILDGYDRVDVNIDHHPDNTNFGEINLIDSKAVSATEILFRIFKELDLTLSNDVVTALLTGLITDTQGFKTPNTTPETLRIAADLYESGADLPRLYFEGITRKTYQAARYWGAGLTQLKFDGQIVWTVLSCEDRQAVEYPGRDDADLVNILSAIEGADVAVLFIEQDHEKVKVSWRSRNDLDVSQLARQFGGGGHLAAAGAMVSGNLKEVQEKVILATKAAIIE